MRYVYVYVYEYIYIYIYIYPYFPLLCALANPWVFSLDKFIKKMIFP